MAYQRLKEYAKAEQVFRNVMCLAKAQNNITWVGIGSGNLGNTLRLQGKHREALPYLYQDVASQWGRIRSGRNKYLHKPDLNGVQSQHKCPNRTSVCKERYWN
ncbi:tetratricopeptide repeat protein [Spirosoma sp. BT702]|uniref:Tetratricopeptide repeat protein n=1 Tax=Spirosoma profusum TaxID=2771354 RepID=A0A927ASY7_9BACT|nr:tetratricopeptide repeat protein [Spirosoma profusum]